MARHNAAVYGVGDRIDFRHGDITSPTVLETLPVDIETIWIDPPWGSSFGDYKRHQNLELGDLTLSEATLPKLVSRLPGSEVAIRVPFNFDVTTLEQPGVDILEFKKKAKTYFYVLRMTRDALVDI
jgi:hypothetical protein